MGTVNKYTLDNVESPNSEKRSVQGRRESSTVCNITTAQRFNQFSASHPCKQGGKRKEEKCWAK
jgi:hypothetical protein